MEEMDCPPREVSPSEGGRPRVLRGGTHATCIPSKAVGTFMGTGPSGTKQSTAQHLLHEHRMSNQEWSTTGSQSPGGGGGGGGGPIASLSHNTVGGLMVHREPGVTSPTRRISVASGLQSKVAARRPTLNRPRTDSRFGKVVRKTVSKTVHSTHLLRKEPHTVSTKLKSLQTIATQTNEADDPTISETASIVESFGRYSRIPVLRGEKTRTVTARERISGSAAAMVSASRNSIATETCNTSRCWLGNVYSLMTMSVSETKLEEIRSSSSISVTVRPVLEAHESCTVRDVNVLRLAMLKSKEVDIDRTLENWKPTTAEVSTVVEDKPRPPAPKSKSKKSIVKKDRAKEAKSKEEKERGEKKDRKQPETVPVTDLDKEEFKVKSRGSSSAKRTTSKTTEQNRTSSPGERRPDSPVSTSASNFRVRFSPHLTSPAGSTASSRAKFSLSGKTVTPTLSNSSIPPRYPELVRRVTDQAITSIAKSVILGLPPSQQKFSRYDPHPTRSYSGYRLPMSSPSYAGNYRPSFQNYPRMPPMTMSSVNLHDDGGYGYPSRNASHMSMASMMNYPSATGSLMGGLHTAANSAGRYPFYTSPHQRMMSTHNHSIPKARKEIDNRYSSLHHFNTTKINPWDPLPTASGPPMGMGPWLRNSSSVYDMHMGEYGGSPRYVGPGTSNNHQFWLRYQMQMKNRHNIGPYSVTSSTSSLYIPHSPPKYERPAQRFSLTRNHHGLLRPSVENVHSAMTGGGSKKAMDSNNAPTSSSGGKHHPIDPMMDERPGTTQYNHDPYM